MGPERDWNQEPCSGVAQCHVAIDTAPVEASVRGHESLQLFHPVLDDHDASRGCIGICVSLDE